MLFRPEIFKGHALQVHFVPLEPPFGPACSLFFNQHRLISTDPIFFDLNTCAAIAQEDQRAGRVNLFFKQFTAITRRYGSFWSFVLRRETENEITRLINKLRWRHKSKTHYL
jgi:hypothetical protein